MSTVHRKSTLAPPARLWQTTTLAIGILLQCAARADGPADAPLPEISAKELAARIRAAWAAYRKGLLEIEFETATNTNRRSEQEPIMVRFPGRVRYQSDGVRWRVDYDSKMPGSRFTKLSPHRWTSGFDGRQRYGYDAMQKIVTLGETEASAEHHSPQNQFWHEGMSFVEGLEQPVPEGTSLRIGQRTVDGVRCYVVERTYPKQETRTEEVVSPRQGYLLVATTWFLRSKPYHLHSLHDAHEVAPGVWAPGRVVDESVNVRKDGTSHLEHRTESRVAAFEPRRTFTAGTFSFVPPIGADVTDRRLGYTYHNDPWWPEAGKLLRERFDWPQADLWILKRLGSPPEFKGKSAPPITAAAWINSPKLELAELKGKVVLVEFWDASCAPCREMIAALRRFYAVYRPHGLQMVSIHTATDDVDAVRRFADDYRITYPIAVDAKGKDGGVTSRAYRVDGHHPSALIVDHEGQVHLLASGAPGAGLVETLVPLLEKAGAKTVPRLALDHPRLSAEMITAVTNALPDWIEAAPKGSSIRGRLVDAQGQPVAGAGVTARLRPGLLILAFPGVYLRADVRRQVAVSSEKDGRFELTGLTKGMYDVTVQARGLAAYERLVAIGPDLQPTAIDFTLTQGDTISGRVRDAEGRPIAGATINPTKRHYSDSRGNDVSMTPSGAEAVRSDAEGRYVLKSPKRGGYTLEVTAPDFEPAVLEAIPSGTRDADATLARPDPGSSEKRQGDRLAPRGAGGHCLPPGVSARHL